MLGFSGSCIRFFDWVHVCCVFGACLSVVGLIYSGCWVHILGCCGSSLIGVGFIY